MQTTISKLLTVKEVDISDADFVSTTYECDVRANIAGDSIWDCELTDLDDVRITTICVNEGAAGGDMAGYRHIGVVYTVNGEEEYEGSWRLYTDSGFEECVSELLGDSVSFTEQGMQEDNYANME